MRGSRRYGILKARSRFVKAQRQIELEAEFQLQTAEDVTRELGQMKGVMMKLGQMASYIETGLNEQARSTLAALQKDAPPMSSKLVEKQIIEELGEPPNSLFYKWDPNPIAAASIGQVHRAITKQGQAVAVKVQYPQVAATMAADLANANWVLNAMAGLFPGVQTAPIVDELTKRLLEELDYESEARNQKYFYEAFRAHPTIVIPQVFEEYSSSRILTTELATGYSLQEVVGWSQQQRNLAAETLFRFSFGAIYQLHAFNGDPHPGNYLFQPDGKVTFLDFGLVKRFDLKETALFESLIQTMVINQDPSGFRRVVESAGLISPDTAFSDEHIYEYFSHYYSYLKTGGPSVIDQAYATAGVEHLLNTDGPYERLMQSLNVPPAFVVVQRITLGLMGIFGRLEACNDWFAISKELWSFVDSEPSTEMGQAIATWEKTRSANL